ncbi:LysM peptidoglycan-binding domain-containing protein [Myxococcota bacterium]|nr:LysM peptidoglycan-binding domain-containing protein [Myxococcota bacterium]
MIEKNVLKKPLWGSLLVAAALATSASPARAQEEDGEDSIPVEESQSEDAPMAPPKAETAAGAQGSPQVAETHSVQGGDTLWDLCSKYLNSPWYWPKIWSYNPQITNPHWIYPGNELRFYPSDENLPTNVEISRQVSMPSSEGDEDGSSTEALDQADLVRTVGNLKVGRTIPSSYFQSYVGFVSNQEHEQAGEIVNAESEAYMLADFDKTYVKLKSAAKKGENYAVYRTIKSIEHPVSGEPYGYAVEIIGGITIVDTSATVATAQVAQAYRPIERGDFVSRWPESSGQRVAPAPNQTEAQGYIIESLGEVIEEIGEHHVVFIDRGRSHGVQVGNTFTVVARGDLYTRETQGLPNEDVGQLLVVDVQEKSATAVVVASLRELSVGDKVEMRR